MSLPGMRSVGCALRIFSSSDIWVQPGLMERALSTTDGSLTLTRPHMHPESNAKTPTMQIMPNLQNIFFICAISTRFLCLKSTIIKCNRFHHHVQLLIHRLWESAVRYNSGHSFEIRTRFPTSPFVKYWTLLVSLGV